MESHGVANDTILYHRKHAIVSSLCKHLSLDPTSLPSESITEHDIKTLFSMVLKLSKDGATKNNEEVMKWVAFADSFPVEPEACHEVLKGLNEDLTVKSILLGDGLKPSEVDILVFATLHYFVSALSNTDRQKVPNVMRWVDYIQNKEGLIEVFERILVEKAQFEPQVSKNATKLEANANMKKSVQSSENVDKLGADLKPKSIAPEKQIPEDAKTAVEKKNLPENVVEKKKLPEKVVEKDTETSVSLLNIQVGLIRKASKHPSADSLLVEEIDVGDGKPRQVVSGLAKYFSPEELVNRHVVLIVNVKPGKLRDVMSSGLVLCASNEDHTAVEPLLPPKGAKLGERVSFSGYDGKPEDVLNPKKKQLEKITPHLYTDDKGVATFKGIPFLTSAGPCTSSIPNAGIK